MLHIFAAVLALSGPTSPVVEARIADVIADPEHYGGQTLRIRGQVDACYGFTCQICPEEMTPESLDGEKCLGFRSRPSKNRISLPPTRITLRRRPTSWRRPSASRSFTGEGFFNPACLTNRPWPPEAVSPGQEDEVVCTDRATTWRGVRVVDVHRRLPSNLGLVSEHSLGALHPAATEIAALVEAAYRKDVAGYRDRPIIAPLIVLTPDEPDFPNAEAEARLCICLKDSCAGQWPSRDISTAAKTPNDPYICYPAIRIGGDWRVFSD